MSESSTAIVELVVAAPVEPWRLIGVPIDDDGVAQVAGVALRFVDGTDGLVAWGLDGAPIDEPAIDGLRTHRAAPPAVASASVGAPLGIVGFDHVVVMTRDLERTCAAIERATGAPLKRVGERGEIRQGFHRVGPMVVEVVESGRAADAEHAAFWGFVWNVGDITATCAALGPDVVSAPRAAVQPGRSIATFRAAVGLGVPLAIMSLR